MHSKKVLCLLFFFLCFFSLSSVSYAATKFSISLTGAEKKGDSMTIFSTISDGDYCEQNGGRISEVGVLGGGAGYPYAADLTNAHISVSLNGSPLPGRQEVFTDMPYEDFLVFHAEPAFQYNQKSDKVTVYVSNARRGNVGGFSLSVYLMDQDYQPNHGVGGCAKGDELYTTATPLSDGKLTPGDLAGRVVSNSLSTDTTPTPKILVASPALTMTPTMKLSPTPILTKKNTMTKPQPTTSWFTSLWGYIASLFSKPSNK